MRPEHFGRTAARRGGADATALMWRAGTLASLLSGIGLIWHSRHRLGSHWRMINAPSQWVHGAKALRQGGLSWRYSLLGAGIHHGSSLWWAWVYARMMAVGDVSPSSRAAAFSAAGVAALAWWVDTRVVPHRFSPGFDRQAGAGGLACIYGAFALGLWCAYRCGVEEAGPSEAELPQ